MRDRARQARRVAAINHEFRFQPARRAALALVRDGAIGEPRRGTILGRYPIWPTPTSRPMSWLSESSRGGGILGAMGSHHTDCLRTFFGEPITALASVRVEQPRRGPSPARPQGGIATADDACTFHYEFAGGANAVVDLSAAATYRWERFEIVGSEGMLRWEGPADRLWRSTTEGDEREVEISAEFLRDVREGDHPLVAPFGVVVERLHEAIEKGSAMEPSFDDAVAVQSALDAVRASSQAGVRVRVEAPPPA
jgi:predicted dehydrogenase